MTEIQRCKTCKHWRPCDDQYDSGRQHGLGRCAAVPMLYEKEEWVEVDGDYVNRIKADAAHITAFAKDGSDYMARLLTRPEHGCTMHAYPGMAARGEE